MAKTAKRLYGPAAVATGPTTIYTVPALTKAVIRQIHVQNPSGSAVTFTLSLGADAAGTRILATQSIPAAGAGVTGNVVDFWMYMIVDAAEIITVSAGTNSILIVAIFGDEITLG